MVLVFDIDGISVAGVKLPLPVHVFEEYRKHLPITLSNAAQVRKEDYVAGRICAFTASSLLGLELSELPTAVDRSPIWPPHLKGSISHSKKLAVSCVSRSESFVSLGIDAEEIISSDVDVSEQIANVNELKIIMNKIDLTILFSAKEALYKAIYPLVNSFVDFKEVEVTQIDHEKKTFLISALSEKLTSLGLHTFQGSYQIIDNTIISLVTIKHKDQYVYP